MNSFSRLISSFFNDYLIRQKGYSPNTLKSYRDSFVSLIGYMDTVKHKKPDSITIKDLDYETINSFLDWLEKEKNVTVSTRNNRLAAIKSFFKYVGFHEPQYLDISSSVREIGKKKTISEPVNYLTIPAIKHFFNSFNFNDRKELRDLCIILLLYESGARVSELCSIRRNELRTEKPYNLILHGKGNKDRLVPVDPAVIELIEKYISEYDVQNNCFLFFNSRKEKLTREGVNHILKKHFQQAKNNNPSLYPDNISAHCLRHSKAMHLLENGVNLVYIRDLLGHTSVTTTEIYSKANPEIKRKYLEAAANGLNIDIDYSQQEKNELLSWLKNNI